MNISSNIQNRNITLSAQGAPSKEASSSDALVERIIDKTYLSANYAGSSLAGAVVGVGGYLRSGISAGVATTASTVGNVLKTEKFGPVLKLVAATGAVAAGVAGTVIAAPVSLIWGAFSGASSVDSSVARQFTIDKAIDKSFGSVSNGLTKFGEGIREDMKELGDYKLKPGEKRIEIPLIRTLQTVVMAGVGAVVGGAVGIATAAASAVAETAKGIGAAWTDDRLNIGEKLFSNVNSVIGGVAHGVSYGVRSGLSTFGQAVGTTWEKESAFQGGKKMFAEAGYSLSASVAPRKTLLEEKQPETVST